MWTLLAIAISAGAYYISTGLGEFWPAAWIAPIPVLMLAFGSSWRRAAAAAFAAYLLGSLNLVRFLARVMPPGIMIAGLAVAALIYMGTVLLARFAERRLPDWAAAFAFPAAWTAYEFLNSISSPHGTSLSLAYSQANFLPALQVASLTGFAGVTFLVTLLPSAVAVAWARRSGWAMAPGFAIVVMALVFGAARLQPEARQAAVRVGMAATDQGVEEAFETKDPALALAVAHAYADRAIRLAAAGAQVVILPEKFVGVTTADSDAIERIFSDAARAGHVTLIAGFNRFTLKPPRNTAAVFGPDGRLLVEYEKHHMLPGPETGYEIGAAPGLFAGPGEQWGVAICKDMDFPGWSRRYGQSGVRFLAVPAWDFTIDGWIHSRMAVLRGVEEGSTIARVAQQGRLTFSDAYGRILAEAPSSRLPEALLVANIPPGPGATVYTRWGDWFGWLTVASLAAIMGAAVLRSGAGKQS